jgi:hypothetical protein
VHSREVTAQSIKASREDSCGAGNGQSFGQLRAGYVGYSVTFISSQYILVFGCFGRGLLGVSRKRLGLLFGLQQVPSTWLEAVSGVVLLGIVGSWQMTTK